jgi:alpha-mannosidase
VDNKNMIVGLTHIDFGWLKGREEMAELFDIYILRLLDLLDNEPSFTYLLEQVLHLKDLSDRRLDLFKRLKEYIKAGRVELACGMASSIETNVPNGECFVRNMQIGLKWIEENLGVEVSTCMMIDTFGFHPQIPQLLQQFGQKHLFANRFGANQLKDTFRAIGIDGSSILVAGRDVNCPCVEKGHVAFGYYIKWSQIDSLFEEVTTQELLTPHIVIPYTENEVVPSLHMIQLFSSLDKNKYCFSTLTNYFKLLDNLNKKWEEVFCDLNPEFTGTFSLRCSLRMENRRVENLLLEAEKWSCLLMNEKAAGQLQEAWWEMAYLQTHDIISGSHPTEVYLDCMERYKRIETSVVKIIKASVMENTIAEGTEPKIHTFTVMNALPWEREEIIKLPIPKSIKGVEWVSIKEMKLPFTFNENGLTAKVTLPAMCFETVFVKEAEEKVDETVNTSTSVIENEFIRLEFGDGYIIKSLTHKISGRVLLENCKDLLVLQEDTGNYQIEAPKGTEISAGAYEFFTTCEISQFGEGVTIMGQFPKMPWSNVIGGTKWSIELFLPYGKPYLETKIQVDWKEEKSRLRYKLLSTLGATENYYEIPFGLVKRNPYRDRTTATGEWATHRFTLMEKDGFGLALANTGVVGVEISNGALMTTILRSPYAELAGMVPDDTSSEHGKHTFAFRVIPYCDGFKNSKTIEVAQELNSPINILKEVCCSIATRCKIVPSNIVLSVIKTAEDGSGDMILRLYEAVGERTVAKIELSGFDTAWYSNLLEGKEKEFSFQGNILRVNMNPFEIKTIRIKAKGAQTSMSLF